MSDAGPAAQTSHSPQSRQLASVLCLLLALTAAVRLPGITRPLAGNFATKNVMYAMIARNWVQGRAGILYPTLDCLVGGRRSLHMLEFPVSAYVTGGLWWIFGGSLDVWGRATAIGFSLGAVALLYLLVRRWHGPAAALGAGAALALSPVSIIYGQSFMLDASLVFFTVATFYGLERWLAGRPAAWLAMASASFALLLLTKVYMLVLLLPLGVTVLWPDRFAAAAANSGVRRRPSWLAAVLAGVAAVVPVTLWCVHATRTAAPNSPQAVHIYSSLQGNAQSYRPPDPLLRDPDFYRQMLDDLTGVILTPLGFALLLAGLLDRAWRRHAPWLLAMLILVAALPRKFYDMNYYHMALLAPLCVMIGLGWKVVVERVRAGRWATIALLLVALLLSMRYAAKPAFVTPANDRSVVAAGRAIQERTAPDEPVVTIHGTTIDLVYYCDRPGWAIAPDTPNLAALLADCRRQGARYLVVAGAPGACGGSVLEEAAEVLTQPPVAWGEGFCVYRIRLPSIESRDAAQDCAGRVAAQ